MAVSVRSRSMLAASAWSSPQTAWWKARASSTNRWRKSRRLDLGVQARGAVGDAGDPGVLDQGDNLGEQGVGALVEALKELVGECEFFAGSHGVGEGHGEGEADLHHGPLAGGTVLLGFRAAGFEGGDGQAGVGL
ncbi:hypothetical protein ACFWC9_10695 [Streptomyces goshikiensis]|uniref:hypothetical protein n=1 Tax=Streptomyces goshikiensis TaxID=1942 RepID=UPI003685E21B